MRTRWLLAIWACFLVRLLFYSSMLPLWEGYDEWSHFAVIRAMALGGEILVARDQGIPRDVEASLEIAPVPWEMRSLPPPSLSEDEFWALPPTVRQQRQAAFRAMPVEWSRQAGSGALKAYEALQAPLYYWLMAPVLWLVRGCRLPWQVAVLRWTGSLIASLAVPLIYRLGKIVFAEEAVALGCAAVAALMPGLALDVARVGNDGLGVVLFTALTVLAVSTPRREWLLGVALGLGLLTKVYFLTAVPALALVMGRRCWKPLVAAAAISGWWFARNLATTGTFTGLSESAMLRETGAAAMWHGALTLPWRTAADAILFSHLYFGGWSSLMVRSWMYHVFYAVILLAALGLLRVCQPLPQKAPSGPGSAANRADSTEPRPSRSGQPVRTWRERAVIGLAAIYAAFWLGEFYNALLEWMSKGLPGSMGWYLYAVAGAEVVLCVAGLSGLSPKRMRGWAKAAATALGALLFAIFDLYTVHAVAIPYYTGMIRHKPNGAIAALHSADFRAVGAGGAFERLSAFQALDPAALMALWTAYMAATALIAVHSFTRSRSRLRSEAGPEGAPSASGISIR